MIKVDFRDYTLELRERFSGITFWREEYLGSI